MTAAGNTTTRLLGIFQKVSILCALVGRHLLIERNTLERPLICQYFFQASLSSGPNYRIFRFVIVELLGKAQ